MKSKWIFLSLAWVTGMLVGLGASAAVFIPRYNKVIEDEKEAINGRVKADAQAAAIVKSEQDAAQMLIPNVRQKTLIYDPQATECVARNGGLQQVFLNDKAIPVPGYPRWILSGKIKPTVIGTSLGVTYTFVDPLTMQYDGPYLPDVVKSRQ